MLDLPTFLTIYPWSPQLPETPPSQEWLWHYTIAGSPEQIWPYIIDTSRLNRLVGYEASSYTERDGMLYGTYDLQGQIVEWAEPPWDWNYARSIVATRQFTNGLMTTLRTIVHLVPDATALRTHVFVYLGAIPRKTAWTPMVSAYFTPRQAGYGAAMQQIERAVLAHVPANAVYRPVPLSLATDIHPRLTMIRTALVQRGLDDELIDRLLDYVLTADEGDLYRIQLVPLAAAWQVHLPILLALCLHAVQEGLLTLSWELICPHCRGMCDSLSELRQLPSEGHCRICEITFDSTGEQSLEVIFHIHPSIKYLPRRYYCLGDAHEKPHIKVQQRIGAGEQRTLHTALPPGHYRMRIVSVADDQLLTIQRGSAPTVVWDATVPPQRHECTPSPHVIMTNSANQERVFIIEDIAWPADALRPDDVLNLQTFRDLFSHESIATQLYVDIGVQTIVFSDIVSSTRLYATHGDAKAFFAVKTHFEHMRAVAQRHDGAVIKTMGDGVMLAFSTAVDGWNAALELQRFFARRTADIDLRIALHTGRCLAVTFNTGIDYFGQTVNIAAKLQLLADTQQIVCSQAVWDGLQDLQRREQPMVEAVRLQHPSLPETIDAYRVSVHTAAPTRQAS